MKSVYIETTIPSFYFETRTSTLAKAWRLATRQWWADERHQYDLWTSRFVDEELAYAPEQKRTLAVDLLRGISRLTESKDVAHIARTYIKNRLMPAEAGGDAFHLAMASFHELDFLLTWNCRHLANANKMEHLRVLNDRLGLPMPVVTTPLNLKSED